MEVCGGPGALDKARHAGDESRHGERIEEAARRRPRPPGGQGGRQEQGREPGDRTMQNLIDRYFLAHPRSVNETYAEHAGVAFRVALRLLGAGLAAAVHAVLPFLFVTTASRTIRALHGEIVARSKTG
jgi:hypothetical protein